MVLCCALALTACLSASESVRANQFVRLDFSLSADTRFRGTAFIELFDDKPLTRDNFMLYVNGGHYDDMLMHRLARNFVLQGGGFYAEFLTEPPPVNQSLNPNAVVDLDGNLATPNPTVVNEYSVGTTRSNIRGTIAMARQSGLPNSADSEWFVNWGNNSGLDAVDGGFTVFAQVVGDGMALFDVYNSSLLITNLNPDTDDNGVRNGGPFGMNANDGVPFFNSSLLELNNADRIDYYGAGGATNVPAGGLTITARDAYFDTGAAFTGTGGWTIGAGRTLGIREGFSLTRNLNNLGTLAPGLEIGAITVQAFQQGAGGTLAIDLRGTTVDTQHDKVTVTGAAQLAGKLKASPLGGFSPAIGNTFTVLSAASISGGFTLFDLPTLDVSKFWRMNQTATSVAITVVGGDYDHNGTVNALDLGVWKTSFGTTVTAFNAGDGNGDGKVNGDDFLIWQRFVGQVRNTPASLGVATAVPEPGAAALALLFAGALRRRRSSSANLAPGRISANTRPGAKWAETDCLPATTYCMFATQ